MTSRMLEEIGQIPGIVERLLADRDGALAAVGREIGLRRPPAVVFVARGSSYFAALYGRHLVETVLRIPTILAAPVVASVYDAEVPVPGALVIALSQAGRSPDIIGATLSAKRSAALTVSIVNYADSPLAAAGDLVVPLGCGPEAVAATKSYVSELAALAAIVTAWSGRQNLVAALPGLPSAIARSIAESAAWLDSGPGIVAEMADASAVQVVSRGYDLATALEVALKLTETGGMVAQGFSATDFRHGPVAASGATCPLLAFRPEGPAGPTVDDAMDAAAVRGAVPWVVGGVSVAGRPRSLALGHQLPPELAPIANVVPGHMLSERVARARGHDPDAPNGLVKVTLTK
jgi:glutamine---fructose-6-phosphate transaminase (isomerizing)